MAALEPQVDVVDLNGDGGPEGFVQVNSFCYGMAGSQLGWRGGTGPGGSSGSPR